MFEKLSCNSLLAVSRELEVKKGSGTLVALSIFISYKGAEAAKGHAHFIDLYSFARMIFS